MGRWVTIKGLKSAPKPAKLRAWRVRTGYDRAGEFECSNKLLNDIHRTTLWTLENLTLGGYIVDCNSRERTGYASGSGDIYSGMWSFRLGGFFTKWLQDWRDAQTPGLSWAACVPWNSDGGQAWYVARQEDGYLPACAPWNGDGGGGPSTMFTAVTMPQAVHRFYGDLRLLKLNYSLSKGWLAWIETRTKDNLIYKYTENPWHFLGDWVWPGAPVAEGMNGVRYSDMPETLFFVNCYWVYTLRTAAKDATTLGYVEDAARYTRRADEVARAVHQKFFNAADNSYVNGGQAYLAIALAAGVPPKELDGAVMKRLEQQIVVRDKGRLNAGQLGLTFLFKLLHERGRDDLVLPMLNTREYPGWGNMLSKGATTWWEDFQGGASLQHFSYLQPAFWLVEAVGGLNADPDSPGFGRFVVKPNVWRDPSLTWARCTYQSEHGRIETGWRIEGARFHLDVTVPPNTTATVYMPARNRESVTEQRQALNRKNMVRWLRDENGYSVFTVQPGRYSFIAAVTIQVDQNETTPNDEK